MNKQLREFLNFLFDHYAKYPDTNDVTPVLAEFIRLQEVRQGQRAIQAQIVRDGIEELKSLQETCSHQHPDGNTKLVFVLASTVYPAGPESVVEDIPSDLDPDNYFLCQTCRKKIFRNELSETEFDQLRRSTVGVSERFPVDHEPVSEAEQRLYDMPLEQLLESVG